MANTTANKEVIYVDLEDEIAAVIDKVVSSDKKIVALVLPKRTNIFHSLVNLRLLKKASSKAKKNIVLVTSDETVTHVAAVAQIHIAKTPKSKPIIPPAKHAEEDKKEETKEEKVDDSDVIELDNTEPLKEAPKRESKAKRIPDFSSFRARFALFIVAIISLGALWYVGFRVMPRATILVSTDTRTTVIDAQFTAMVGTDELDLEENVIPASRVQVEKIAKKTVQATGTKNIGEKATGTVTLTNCIKDFEPKVVAAGTQFSKDSFVYVTTEQIILEPALYQGDVCRSAEFPGLGAVGDVPVQASQPGGQYNIPAGNLNSSISGISSYGSQMTGGTTKNVTVISEEDVENVSKELIGENKNSALVELKEQLVQQGVMSLEATFNEGDDEVLSSPAIGKEAKEVEVTVTTSYSMLGVKEDDMNSLLENEIQKVIQDETQNVRDNGLSNATYELVDTPNQAEQLLSIRSVATIGPEINVEQLKIDMAGKTRGEIEKTLEAIDGVKSVTVEYSPAWITTTPNSPDKLVFKIDENSDE